jgi:hypothetical protein
LLVVLCAHEARADQTGFDPPAQKEQEKPQVVVAIIGAPPGLLSDEEIVFLVESVRKGLSVLAVERFAVVATRAPTDKPVCDEDCANAILWKLGGRYSLTIGAKDVSGRLGVSAVLKDANSGQVLTTLDELIEPTVSALLVFGNKAVVATVAELEQEAEPPAPAPAPVPVAPVAPQKGWGSAQAAPQTQLHDTEIRVTTPDTDQKRARVFRIVGHSLFWPGVLSVGAGILYAALGGLDTPQVWLTGIISGGLEMIGGAACWTGAGLSSGLIERADIFALRVGPGIYSLQGSTDFFTLYYEKVYWTVLRYGGFYGWAAWGMYWGTAVGYPIRLDSGSDLRVGVGFDGGFVVADNAFGSSTVMDVPDAWGPILLVEAVYSKRLGPHFALQAALELHVFTIATDDDTAIRYRPPHLGISLGFAI